MAVATVDQAAGARAKTIVLANLAEGTFPTRDSVERAEGSGDPEGVGRSFSREMARFLRVLGSAERFGDPRLPDARREGTKAARRGVP